MANASQRSLKARMEERSELSPFKEEELVLKYDSRWDHRLDKILLVRWEGAFILLKAYDNGTYDVVELGQQAAAESVNGYCLKKFNLRRAM